MDSSRRPIPLTAGFSYLMKAAKLLPIIVALISPQWARSQQSQEIIIREPAVIKLADLFDMSDRVALVKVISGDTESVSKAVSKAQVLTGFKGAAEGNTLYFGPSVGVL